VNRARALLLPLLVAATLGTSYTVGCAEPEEVAPVPRNRDAGRTDGAPLDDGGRDGDVVPDGATDARIDGTVDTGTDARSDVATDTRPDATTTPDATTQPDAVVGPATCGNGKIEGTEICDDGNRTDGDGCSANCDSVECYEDASFEDPVTHHCYRRFYRNSDQVSRSEAASRCAAWYGGYLVRIKTAALRTQIGPTVMFSGNSWIGLQKGPSNDWVWDDGTTADPSQLKWGPREPSGDGPCVEWHKNGDDLNDLGCGNRRDFVCERAPKGTK
jgi:cysteine-rich repeat protein